MASEVSSIQSLKAVDAWIDVINANINGGVRTAFKSSRLRFAGSNTLLDRPATASTLPLQFPEPSLVTANTVIDFSQGAITSSTEVTHLAIQGEGFFLLAHPEMMNADGSVKDPATVANRRMLVSRDGEFHRNEHGVLVHSSGYLLVSWGPGGISPDADIRWSSAWSGASSYIRCIYDDITNPGPPAVANRAFGLSQFLSNDVAFGRPLANGSPGTAVTTAFLITLSSKQNLRYSEFGSTTYDFGFAHDGNGANLPTIGDAFATGYSDATVLSKALEASNSSMTQSVPELSLAQKLFSALTKVIQIHQTNVDSVLNTVR